MKMEPKIQLKRYEHNQRFIDLSMEQSSVVSQIFVSCSNCSLIVSCHGDVREETSKLCYKIVPEI